MEMIICIFYSDKNKKLYNTGTENRKKFTQKENIFG
jgi:hypothetical protein